MEWSEEKKIKLERVTRSRKKKNTDWYEANGVSSSARERERRGAPNRAGASEKLGFRLANFEVAERESGFGWWSDSEEKRREEPNRV